MAAVPIPDSVINAPLKVPSRNPLSAVDPTNPAVAAVGLNALVQINFIVGHSIAEYLNKMRNDAPKYRTHMIGTSFEESSPIFFAPPESKT